MADEESHLHVTGCFAAFTLSVVEGLSITLARGQMPCTDSEQPREYSTAHCSAQPDLARDVARDLRRLYLQRSAFSHPGAAR